MSDTEPPIRDPDDPDTEPFRKVGTGERKRAAMVLGVLAVAAVLVAGVMIYALGSSNGSDKPSSTNQGGPAVTVTGAPSETTGPSATKPKPKPTTATRSSGPRTGPVSCPTSAPCALPDDIGNAVQALNAYRAAHHQGAVTGSVTKAAQSCAVHNGDGSSCPSGYYWEPVGRSGSQVIDKIAASGGKGTAWLVNPKMTAVQVGWAYIPSSKSFECVVVSNA